MPPRSNIKKSGIPLELRRLSRWACWRYAPKDRGGKAGKPPFNPLSGEYASPTDPATWVSFDEAWEGYQSGDYDGISFALSGDDDIVGIDLDDCRNPNNKRNAEWAQGIIDDLNSYTEVSPSGNGIRVFLYGELPQNRHKGKVEAYTQAKFLTVTGKRLHTLPAELKSRPDALNDFYAEWFPQEQGESETPKLGITISPDREPPSNKLRALLRMPKAKAAFHGESDHASQSERDLALANYAAGQGWKPQEIADLLVQARFNVGEEPKHLGYYESTIGTALNGKLAKPRSRKRPKPIRRAKPLSSVAPGTLAEAKKVFNRCLYLEDDSVVDLILAMAAGNRLSGDPLWLYLIAPPSSGKTELVLSLQDTENAFFLSDVTAAAFISGYVDPIDGDDKSLLPQLDGKLVIFKDFTVILSKPAEARNQIYGIMRDAYDGYASRAMGTDTKGFHSKFNVLAAVTPEIERHWSLQALGERFLSYRLNVENGDEHIRRALQNGSTDIRSQLKQAAESVLANLPTAEPKVPDELLERTILLSKLLSTGRTYIPREREKRDIHIQPELGARVAKQLLRLGKSIALVNGRDELADYDFNVMRRVAFDSMPGNRLAVLRQMLSVYPKAHPVKFFTGQIASIEDTTIRRHLDDLHLLRMADKERRPGRNQYQYRLAKEYAEACHAIGLTQ